MENNDLREPSPTCIRTRFSISVAGIQLEFERCRPYHATTSGSRPLWNGIQKWLRRG